MRCQTCGQQLRTAEDGHSADCVACGSTTANPASSAAFEIAAFVAVLLVFVFVLTPLLILVILWLAGMPWPWTV